MTVDRDSCAQAIQDGIGRLLETQDQNIKAAGDLIAECVERDSIVQAFGTGHSQALAMEIAGRAGGLVPTNLLSLRDIVMFGGCAPEVLSDPLIERDPGIAHRIYELATVGPGDLFVIASNSGGNGSVVELALVARDRGHKVVAFTSLAHSRAIESRHPSGSRLFEIADVVIDNCAPFGDAVLDLPGGGSVCAVSSITSAFAAQMCVAHAVGRLLGDGVTPPVYLSANVPAGDRHNARLEERYAGRIRRGAT